MDAVLTASLDPDDSAEFIRAIVVGQLETQGMEATEENIAAFTTLLEGQLAGMEMFSQADPDDARRDPGGGRGLAHLLARSRRRMPLPAPRSPRSHRRVA